MFIRWKNGPCAFFLFYHSIWQSTIAVYMLLLIKTFCFYYMIISKQEINKNALQMKMFYTWEICC